MQRMGMRLWRVTVERTIMVMADDERGAERAAEYHMRDDDGDSDMIQAREMKSVEAIPKIGHDCIPWGGDRKDDRTCAERLEPHTVAISDDAP